jgi:hypothetical protein
VRTSNSASFESIHQRLSFKWIHLRFPTNKTGSNPLYVYISWLESFIRRYLDSFTHWPSLFDSCVLEWKKVVHMGGHNLVMERWDFVGRKLLQ